MGTFVVCSIRGVPAQDGPNENLRGDEATEHGGHQKTVVQRLGRTANDFIATLRTDAKYCEPSAQDVKLMVDLTYRNEETELPDGLPEAIAKEMQRLLMSVGCPDWRGDDGRWGASSSTQFAEFLRKTGQEEAYEAVKNTTVIRIKALFDKWRPQNDFISTLNTDVTYCYPLHFGGEDAVRSKTKIDVDLRFPQPKLAES